MSTQSKYFAVTNQVLLEYRTDQYKITNINNEVGEDISNLYMYQGLDGNQYCIEETVSPEDGDVYTQVTDTKYTDENNSTYYYAGKNNKTLELDETDGDGVYGAEIYVNNDEHIGTVIKDINGNQLRKNIDLNHDTIRLYILTGYVMNTIGGYSIKVKSKISQVSVEDPQQGTIIKRVDDYLYLLDWYMPKELLKDKIHWLANPLYMNSKFYDRYIEIKLPAPLDIALNNRNIDYVYEYIDEDSSDVIYMRGTINQYAGTVIEFATIQPENVELVKDSANDYESHIVLDVPRTFAIYTESNSNNFNVRLLEDPASHSIIYYPVYGDLNNSQGLDYDMMLKIETGTIPMIDMADLDSANEGMDDFIEMYGDETFRWIIINELTVKYVYENIFHTDNDDNSEEYTEYYTNTIDYTGKNNMQHEFKEFYKSKFIPYIKERNNMTCKTIVISYTAHLYNRMNNIDIVRNASMVVKDPYKYTLTTINTDNVVKYKIVNKIDKQTVNHIVESTPTNDKLIREYYDVTNLIAKNPESGLMYTQGKMVLYLKHSNSNYMIRLYTLNNDNTRVPYDLTGPYQYKLVFPNISGGKIEIFPNKDSENYNLGIGSLIFYITEDKARAIMNVPTSERYFALTTHYDGNSQEETALYEGGVQWYV